jgi:hypothetical protein
MDSPGAVKMESEPGGERTAGLTPKLEELQRKWLGVEKLMDVDDVSFDTELCHGQTRPKSLDRVNMFVAKLKEVPPLHRITIIAWQSAGMTQSLCLFFL